MNGKRSIVSVTMTDNEHGQAPLLVVSDGSAGAVVGFSPDMARLIGSALIAAADQAVRPASREGMAVITAPSEVAAAVETLRRQAAGSRGVVQ